MSSEESTLSSLSANKEVTKLEHSSGAAPASGGWRSGSMVGMGLVLFIVLVIIVFVIIVATRPRWILRCKEKEERCGRESSSSEGNGEDKNDVDYGKALLWSIVVAIGLIILFWILYALAVGTRWC
jgi:uncharacterized membrane protein